MPALKSSRLIQFLGAGLVILLVPVLLSFLVFEAEPDQLSIPGEQGSAANPDRDTSEDSGEAVFPAGSARDTREQVASNATALDATADPLAFFKDTRIPLSRRMDRIQELGRGMDSESSRALMLLGDAHIYLNWAAVEALGQRSSPEVVAYLEGKLGDENHQVLRAAIKSYARVKGNDSAEELVRLLKANHQRADGYDQEICSDIVRILGKLHTPRVAEALLAELARASEAGWSLEYGSLVVEALGKFGTTQASEALVRYANHLVRSQPQDPLARQYHQDKIAEARKAAAIGH